MIVGFLHGQREGCKAGARRGRRGEMQAGGRNKSSARGKLLESDGVLSRQGVVKSSSKSLAGSGCSTCSCVHLLDLLPWGACCCNRLSSGSRNMMWTGRYDKIVSSSEAQGAAYVSVTLATRFFVYCVTASLLNEPTSAGWCGPQPTCVQRSNGAVFSSKVPSSASSR